MLLSNRAWSAVDQKNQRHHHQHEANHQPGEFFDPFVEGGFDLPPGETAGHFSKIGVRAGRNDDRGGRTALDACAEKTKIRALN